MTLYLIPGELLLQYLRVTGGDVNGLLLTFNQFIISYGSTSMGSKNFGNQLKIETSCVVHGYLGYLGSPMG